MLFNKPLEYIYEIKITNDNVLAFITNPELREYMKKYNTPLSSNADLTDLITVCMNSLALQRPDNFVRFLTVIPQNEIDLLNFIFESKTAEITAISANVMPTFDDFIESDQFEELTTGEQLSTVRGARLAELQYEYIKKSILAIQILLQELNHGFIRSKEAR